MHALGSLQQNFLPTFRLRLLTKKNIRVLPSRCGGCASTSLSPPLHHSQQLAVLHHHRPSSIKRRRLASRPLHARRRCQKAYSALALAAHLLGPCRVTDSTLKQQQRHILARWAQEQQGEQQQRRRRRHGTHPTPAVGDSFVSSGSPVHTPHTHCQYMHA